MQSTYSFNMQLAFVNSQNADMRPTLVLVVHQMKPPHCEVPPIRYVPVNLFTNIERMTPIST